MNEKNLLKEVLHLKILLHQKFANIKKKQIDQNLEEWVKKTFFL